jgi:hypothetical protein
MAINRLSISSQSIKTNTEAVIEVLYTEPPAADESLNPAQTPGKLVAYYNGSNDTTKLYIVSRSGLRMLPM